MPSPKSVPLGRVVSASRLSASVASWVFPLRVEASISSGNAHMETYISRGVLAGLQGRPPCLVVAAEAVKEDRGRPARVRHRDSLSPGAGLIDGGLDQRGGFGFPASQTRKQQGAVRRDASPGCFRHRLRLRRHGRGRCEVTTPRGGCAHRGQIDRQPVKRAGLADDLDLPCDNRAPARRNVGAAAARPSVISSARPLSSSSIGPGGSDGGSALAAREISSRSSAPARCPAKIAAPQASR